MFDDFRVTEIGDASLFGRANAVATELAPSLAASEIIRRKHLRLFAILISRRGALGSTVAMYRVTAC
jgi:hypothetical protein